MCAGHNYIGTEHILMGLLREGEGVAARVLETLGADQTKIRTQVRGRRVQAYTAWSVLESCNCCMCDPLSRVYGRGVTGSRSLLLALC